MRDFRSKVLCGERRAGSQGIAGSGSELHGNKSFCKGLMSQTFFEALESDRLAPIPYILLSLFGGGGEGVRREREREKIRHPLDTQI